MTGEQPTKLHISITSYDGTSVLPDSLQHFSINNKILLKYMLTLTKKYGYKTVVLLKYIYLLL